MTTGSMVTAGALALLLIGAAAAPGAAQDVDVSQLGPQVGERMPDFTLTDQQGERRTLQSIMGPSGAMLLVSRSADW